MSCINCHFVDCQCFPEEDKIAVVDNYCLACKGECSNDDVEDYDHLLAEFESMIGSWVDKGVSPSAAWAFLASVLLSIAKENDLDWDEVQESLHGAWKKGSREDE